MSNINQSSQEEAHDEGGAEPPRGAIKNRGGISQIRSIAQGCTEGYKLPFSKIKIRDGLNNRETRPELETHIESLMISISNEGLLTPLVGWMEDGEFWVSDGHCRYEAMRRGHEQGMTMPELVEVRLQSNASEDTILFAQIGRNTGLGFTPLEQSRVLTKLINVYGWSEEDAAQRAGWPLQRVRNLLELSALPLAIQNNIQRGELSASLAQRIVTETGSTAEAVEVAKRTVQAAKEDGAKRALPRHAEDILGQRPTKKQLREIFEMRTQVEEDDERGEVTLRMSNADYEKYRNFFKGNA